MKKWLALICALVLALGGCTACAEEIDISDLSAEELRALQERIAERLQELEDSASGEEAAPEAEPAPESADAGELVQVDPVALRSARDDYAGQVVATVMVVDEAEEDTLRGYTDAGKSLYDFVADFADASEIAGLQEGDVVMLAGTVQESSLFDFGDLHMEDCHILSSGEDAASTLEEMQAESAQRQAEQVAQDKEAYAQGCESVDYSDVERNPDSYEGKHIVVSGTVVDVTEGWLDTTTLLVKDGKNIWMVEYERPEGSPRVLEKDVVTAYGECKGVDESFTAILYDADSETIPAMDAKYIDLK